jgi:hypothetical protein
VTVDRKDHIVHSLVSIQPLEEGSRRYITREQFMDDDALREQKSAELLLSLLAIVDNAQMAKLHEIDPRWTKVYAAAEGFPQPKKATG